MQDPIVQTKTCAITGKEFSITQGDLDFYAKISPTFAGQKFAIPTPTLCPEERQRRRLAFRNERNLYRRTCDASGKQIISIYSPDKPYKVYDQKIRRSDSRDPMEYGRDFDFSKTFTENFSELLLKVPVMSLLVDGNENSEYANQAGWDKNCYLVFCSDHNEDCMYTNDFYYSKDSLDCYYSYNLSGCYQCIDCENCYELFYAQHCRNCSLSFHLKDCESCKYCFGCFGLTNQQYCIFNQQVGKDEYQEFINKFYQNQNSVEGIDLQKLSNNIECYLDNCEDCIGKNLRECKMCNQCFDSNKLEYSKYCNNIKGGSYLYDVYRRGHDSNWCYEVSATGENTSRILFCSQCWGNSSEIYYSDLCLYSSHLFGCVGLRNKSYCIFNKQYTKEGYEQTVAKIINHMIETKERGEFFHPSLSPFGYNETVAQEYYPLEKSESLAKGYKRSDYEAPKPVSDKVIQGKDLPSTIQEVQDDILQYAIACEITGKLFRLQPQELVFYRKHNIPLPRKHPDQRHLERLQLRK